MQKSKLIIFLLRFILIISNVNFICYAQTTVGGDIYSNATWYFADSPYEVNEDIYIREEATLFIEKGVTVNFQNRYFFVGKYKSGKIIADSVFFKNGRVQFNKESDGSILNSTFHKVSLYLEDYSFPVIQKNVFDKDSPVFAHSIDAFSNFQKNTFSDGNIIFSFEIEQDINLPFIENCNYEMDNDIFIGNGASVNIDNHTHINLRNHTIYVGNYSDGYLNSSGTNIRNGRIQLSDNSNGRLINNNISNIDFELMDSAMLTIANSNLDSISTIKNNSDMAVEAIDNYWGRPEGPIMNDSVTVLSGDVDYIPFSSIPIDPLTGIIKNKTMPVSHQLLNNYPNPFNSTTTINYSVGDDFDIKSKTVIKVYNLMGHEIETIVNKYHKPGHYSIVFDASKLASGFYIYRLIHGPVSMNSKMLYLK